MKKLGTLAWLFLCAAIVAALVGSIVVVRYHESGWADVGKALLTLAVTFFVGGVAAVWVKVVEQAREDENDAAVRKREVNAIWAGLLRDVVEVDQTVAVARQLIWVHKTARTYSEQ